MLPAYGVALHTPGVSRSAERTVHGVPAHRGEPPERPPIYNVQIVAASTQPRDDMGSQSVLDDDLAGRCRARVERAREMLRVEVWRVDRLLQVEAEVDV